MRKNNKNKLKFRIYTPLSLPSVVLPQRAAAIKYKTEIIRQCYFN